MPSLHYKYKDSLYEEVFKIEKNDVRAGRLPSNDIVLLDSSVSRNHFMIQREGDGYFLYDNGSSNGTFLNETKITGRTKLNDNDRISAGSVVFIFRDEPLTTVKEVPAAELNSIASSPSLVNNVYLDIIFSVARNAIYLQDQPRFYADTIRLACEAMQAEYGAILLLNEETGELTLSASNNEAGPGIRGISSSILNKSIKNRAGLLVKNASLDNRFSGDRTVQDMGISSAICAPIWERDHVYGAVYADRRTNFVQFSEENLSFLTILANLLALYIAHEKSIRRIAEERDITEQIKRFVPMEAVSGLLDMIKNNPSSTWNVQEASRSTVLFADIVGFTSLTEKSSPLEVARILRVFFDKATSIVLANGGSINKFLGDGFMAVFGTPVSHDNDADRAIRSAVSLIEWVKKGETGTPIALRIGMDTGPVVGIMVGSAQRLEYTVIGNTVNVAARLQAMADVNQVLISSGTNGCIKTPVNTKLIGETAVKGKQNHVTVYRVVC